VTDVINSWIISGATDVSVGPGMRAGADNPVDVSNPASGTKLKPIQNCVNRIVYTVRTAALKR
jgi:hypothetical protein